MTANELQPVRLDAPRVQADACGGANRHARGAEKPASADHGPLIMRTRLTEAIEIAEGTSPQSQRS